MAIISSASAQQNVGRILGTLRDTSGAVIVGVEIAVTNQATGFRLETLSNEVGAYTFPAVNVGTYSLTASKSGFKQVVRENLRVVAGLTVTVDLELPLGQTVETISVDAAPPIVDQVSTTAGLTQTVEELRNVPLQISGAPRSSLAFLRTLSAVAPSRNLNATETAVIQGSGDGSGWGGFPGYSVDGISASSTFYQGLRDEAPLLPEVVEEFRMVTNIDASSGGNMGTTVELVTKSGTNAFHGGLFEYFRNEKLDARSFFAPTVAVQRQNEYGGTLGGPIRKDRLFFFGSYNRYHYRTSQPGTSTVPTNLMRSGDFSEFLGASLPPDAMGRPVLRGQIFDPLSSRPDGRGGFIRDPFPNNRLPTNRLSPVSLAFQRGIPAPNLPGAIQNLIGTNAPTPTDSDKMTAKVDYQINAAHRLTGAVETLLRKDTLEAGGLLSPEISGARRFDTRQPRYRFNYNWVIRPTLLFSLRAAQTTTPTTFGTKETPAGDHGAAAGLRGVYTPNTPRVTIQGATSFGNTFYRVKRNHQGNPADADLAWIKGRHNVKFGAQFSQQTFFLSRDNNTAGTFAFTDQVTALPSVANTGHGYASFLLGEVNNASLIYPEGGRWASRGWGFYAQDQWRVTSKLTLNIGLRYDISTAPTESHRRMASFDPNAVNPAAGGLLGALSFWGNGAGRNGRSAFFDTYRSAWGPRFGFAYSWNSKTVLRGYYGIVYSPVFADVTAYNLQYGWSSTLTPSTLNNGITPAFNWTNGFPNTQGPLPNLNPSLQNNNNVLYVDATNGIPTRSQNLGFGIERQLPGEINLRLDYVGKLTHGAPRLGGYGAFGVLNGLLINQIDPSYLRLGAVLQANINSAQAQAAGITAPYPGFTGSVAQALRPYPQYQDIEQYNNRSGFSLYHAFEVNVQKRFRRGYNFLVSYTASKNLVSGDIQHHRIQGYLAKSIATFDRAQNLAISYGYELPFGPGKRFANSATGVVRHLVAGWQITGLHNYIGGTPVVVTGRSTIPGIGAAFPVAVPAQSARTGISCADYDPNDPTRNLYLNPAAFASPAPFTFGDTNALPSTRTCGVISENVSFFKTTSIRESVRVVFGAEFFNILNRHSWDNLQSDINNPAATYGRYTATTDPRTIQLHLKVQF